jgi:hypothetical protein
MALEPGTYYKLACENCGPEGFAGDEIMWRVCESEEEARGCVEDCGGRVEEDGRVWCSTCIEEGEDHSEESQPMPKTEQIEGGSPKVPEEWPRRIEVSCGSNICGDPIYSVVEPCPAPPNPGYNPETETYIPVSALLSDEIVEALSRSRYGREVEAFREEGGGWDDLDETTRNLWRVGSEAHLQAAIDQLGGTDAK